MKLRSRRSFTAAFLVALLCALTLISPALAKTITGNVVGVTDGDTLQMSRFYKSVLIVAILTVPISIFVACFIYVRTTEKRMAADEKAREWMYYADGLQRTNRVTGDVQIFTPEEGWTSYQELARRNRQRVK